MVLELPNLSNYQQQVMNDGSKIFISNPDQLLELVEMLYNSGHTHLSTIIGFEANDKLYVDYPISAPNVGANSTNFVRVELPKDNPEVNSINSFFPGGIVYEQEITDFLGIKFKSDKPRNRLLLPDTFPENLYPLRKEYTSADIRKTLIDLGVGQEKTTKLKPHLGPNDYSISVGPQHPTHKEPIRFQFYVEGETIQDVDLRIGFNHRGIEKALEDGSWTQNLYLIERICGICSAAHQLAYTVTAEKIAGIIDEIPDRAQWLRVLISELERIHSHILWYGVLAHDGGYDYMFHVTWRDRELVMDILEKLTGNRVNYSIETIGGVRRDIDEDTRKKTLEQLKKLRVMIIDHYNVLQKEKSFLKRIENIGVLSYQDAIKMNAVGPTARSSGVDFDLRRDFPYAAYKDIPLEVFTRKEGDVMASMMVRLDETIDSVDQCIYILENLPAGDINIKVKKRLPEGTAHTRVEAPRGEDIHYIRSTGGTGPDRHKVRAPTLANITSLLHRFKGMEVADIPMIIRLIDPCIGCMERVTFTDLRTEKSVDVTGDMLISKANRKYRLNSPVRLFEV
ncbi:MAG: NADH-quinone oxidoreductase subunit C [Candidatus Heimdallarchaeota archaeon]|nr:NADH-quinone oxidoreductase subunit C [Candidatus Heimdallarchaeota archaeon]